DGHVRSLIDVHRVVVSVDAVTNHVGALGLRPGTVVAAGTGVIALGIGADGRSARADGWGYILGDDGSGYQIGRRGLASALREVDGRGGSALLRAKAQERFGDLEGLSVTVYAAPNPVGLVASFSTDVAEAACDGDAIARAIWEDAAAEIARTALAVTSRVFEAAAVVTVSWTGGLFAEEELLLEPFRAQVAREWPAAQLCPPRADALMGGLLLARSDLPRSFEGLVYRFNAQKEAGRMR
ncbi:MAG: hypothetical protein H0V09_10720, partial [Gemmatimonadetes bacterium]|nr:hypothetical protein [Gemmatimonadota bacterium]